ncbi:MAG: DUF3299 domain-containing protein [Xanthomonadales bacterium]|nr:DUF3299 domain-containing protein [Xanthomonadales bacterium]
MSEMPTRRPPLVKNLVTDNVKILLAILLLALAASGQTQAEALKVEWKDLVPEGEPVATQSMDPMATLLGESASQDLSGSLVTDFNGKTIRLPGFLVPVASDEVGLLSEFFLVPYFGACIHVPPPPPNQIVYVKLDKPFDLKNLWTPFWVEGEMSTQAFTSVMGTAGYTITANLIEEYQW